MTEFDLSPAPYGFRWGPARIVRVCSDPKWGVVLDVVTPRQRLEIRVTPSGLIRLGKPTAVRKDEECKP